MYHTDSLQKISKYLSELETRHIKPEGSLSLSRKERINSARYMFRKEEGALICRGGASSTSREGRFLSYLSNRT